MKNKVIIKIKANLKPFEHHENNFPNEKIYIFEILLNRPKIRLYLPFSDWFVSKRTLSVWIQINRKMANAIWFGVDLIRFRKYFSVWRLKHGGIFCTLLHIHSFWVAREWIKLIQIYTKKFILNLVKSNQIWIVITIFWLIWHQTEFRLIANNSEKCNSLTKGKFIQLLRFPYNCWTNICSVMLF